MPVIWKIVVAAATAYAVGSTVGTTVSRPPVPPPVILSQTPGLISPFLLVSAAILIISVAYAAKVFLGR